MRCHLSACLVLLAACLGANSARAELTVIYDSGVTQPLAPFLDVFNEPPPTLSIPTPPEPTGQLGAADPAQLLPIRSPGLTPGPVSRRPLRLPHQGTLSQPFFLIGSDDRSRAWLAQHRERLQAIGAVGMLVQADTEADLAAIADLADGIPILPAPATDIARALGLDHIPVLVSRHGLEQ